MNRAILVAGFGRMGCRHVQSLLQSGDRHIIYVVEPNDNAWREGLRAINANPQDINRLPGLDNLPPIDFAILATSAGPRFDMFELLVARGVKYFLLEKIVFQSQGQFDRALENQKLSGASVHCNFVSRYFVEYERLQTKLENRTSKLTMTVTGGDFGLGCNAVHYIDVFQYLTGNNVLFFGESLVKKLDTVNKRGNEYVEFEGVLCVKNEIGDELLVQADPRVPSNVAVSVHLNNEFFRFDELAEEVLLYKDQQIKKNKFEMLRTSVLTRRIVDEMFSGTCRLTPLADTRAAHTGLFKVFNAALGLDDRAICPIT